VQRRLRYFDHQRVLPDADRAVAAGHLVNTGGVDDEATAPQWQDPLYGSLSRIGRDNELASIGILYHYNLMADWRPVLPDTPDPIYRRLAEALARDCRDRRPPAGAACRRSATWRIAWASASAR
jgi:hypothetical protein